MKRYNPLGEIDPHPLVPEGREFVQRGEMGRCTKWFFPKLVKSMFWEKNSRLVNSETSEFLTFTIESNSQSSPPYTEIPCHMYMRPGTWRHIAWKDTIFASARCIFQASRNSNETDKGSLGGTFRAFDVSHHDNGSLCIVFGTRQLMVAKINRRWARFKLWRRLLLARCVCDYQQSFCNSFKLWTRILACELGLFLDVCLRFPVAGGVFGCFTETLAKAGRPILGASAGGTYCVCISPEAVQPPAPPTTTQVGGWTLFCLPRTTGFGKTVTYNQGQIVVNFLLVLESVVY